VVWANSSNVVKAKSYCPEAKAYTFEAKTTGLEAKAKAKHKAFRPTARAEIQIRSTSPVNLAII